MAHLRRCCAQSDSKSLYCLPGCQRKTVVMGRSLTTWRFVWISTSLGLRMSVLVIPFSILYGWKLESSRSSSVVASEFSTRTDRCMSKEMGMLAYGNGNIHLRSSHGA